MIIKDYLPDNFTNYDAYIYKTACLRGSKPTSDEYISIIGDGFSFGTFADEPYADLLSEKLNIDVFNFSILGAGPHSKYLKYFIEEINKGKCCILQVMSARGSDNSKFRNNYGGYNIYDIEKGCRTNVDAFWGEIIKPNPSDEIAKEIATVYAETKERYMFDYKNLFDKIKVPIILLYIGRNPPSNLHKHPPKLWSDAQYPHIVDADMVDGLKKFADSYVEHAGDEGYPHKLAGFPKYSDTDLNAYFPTPEMHQEISRKLTVEVDKMLNITKDVTFNMDEMFDINGYSQDDRICQDLYDKVFVINLEERLDRFKFFENIDRVERVVAIDSRDDQFIFKKYGFNITPIIPHYSDYMFRSPGFSGCFLSHYLTWKKIVAEKLECAIILEDDVYLPDLTSMLRRGTRYDFEKIDMVQLNKRTYRGYNTKDAEFIGLESYVISRRGCEKMISIVEDYALIAKYYSPPKSIKYGIEAVISLDRIGPNSMVMPIDVLVGSASNTDIPESMRLEIAFDNCVSLDEGLEYSDVSESGDFYAMSVEELRVLRKSNDYCKWRRKCGHIETRHVVGIVAMAGMGATKLCNKLGELDENIIPLYSPFDNLPDEKYNEPRPALNIEKIINTELASDPSVRDTNIAMFEILPNCCTVEDISNFFNAATISPTIIFLYSNPISSYKSEILELLNAGLHKHVRPFEEYKRVFKDWHGTIRVLCEDQGVDFITLNSDEVDDVDPVLKDVISRLVEERNVAKKLT